MHVGAHTGSTLARFKVLDCGEWVYSAHQPCCLPRPSRWQSTYPFGGEKIASESCHLAGSIPSVFDWYAEENYSPKLHTTTGFLDSQRGTMLFGAASFTAQAFQPIAAIRLRTEETPLVLALAHDLLVCLVVNGSSATLALRARLILSFGDRQHKLIRHAASAGVFGV